METLKTFDADALQICVQGFEDGTSYNVIAEQLNELGYTKRNGKPIEFGCVSYQLTKNGYTRKNREETVEVEAEEEAPSESSEAQFVDPQLQAILELMNSGKFTEVQLKGLIKAVLTSDVVPDPEITITKNLN